MVRADVHRDAECLVAEARPHRDDGLCVVHGDGDFPAPFAQCHLQALHDREIAVEQGQSPFALERVHQAAQIARGRVHVGLGDLDIVQANRGIELDRHGFGGLAHDLAMRLALGRHVDHHVAQDPGGAGKPPPGFHGLAGDIGLLDLGEGREVVGARDDAVLGELALDLRHLAAAADAAATAHGINVDAERARGLQDRRAEGEAAPQARGREDDGGVVSHGVSVLRAGCAPPRLPSPLAVARGTS